MNAFWAERSARERALLTGGLVVALVFILVQFVFSPLTNFRSDARRDLARAEGIYADVSRSVAAGAQETDADTSQPLRTAIARTAPNFGVSVSRIGADEGDRVDVVIDSAASASLLSWMDMLERDYGADVARAVIRRNRYDQSVSAQVTFARGGGRR